MTTVFFNTQGPAELQLQPPMQSRIGITPQHLATDERKPLSTLTSVTLQIGNASRLDGGVAVNDDSGYGGSGCYGLMAFGRETVTDTSALSSRRRRSVDGIPDTAAVTENPATDTGSNGPSSMVPIKHSLNIRTDYSNYSLTEFLDSMALALKDPFGVFFKQIAEATGASQERVAAAKEVGGHISDVLQMAAGPGGMAMHAVGSAFHMGSNAVQGKPPEIDDFIDVSSIQRVVLPSPDMSPTSAGSAEPAAAPERDEVASARSRPVSENASVNAVEFRPLTADELAPYRSPHTATAGEIESTGLYVIQGQALVPINGALYRIQTDSAGQSRLVEPGKQVFDTGSPYVMPNKDGSFAAGYPRLVGGGGGSSKQARAHTSADSGYSRSHSSLSGTSNEVSRSASMSSGFGTPIDSPATARNTRSARTGRENISVFEVPFEDRAALEDAINFGASKWQLDPDYASGRVPEDFVEARYRLLQKSNAFYATLRLSARPEMPLVTANTSADSFIRDVYEHADGLVIGEHHNSMASKQFLIDNMVAFKRQQVTTLYMEHLLTDFHQEDLDAYFDTGTMSDKLKGYLKTQDDGQGTNGNSAYTFRNVVETARRNQIRIQAVDAAASYHLKEIYDPVPGPTRQKAMNYVAQEVIKSDTRLNGRHHWVALVGNTHANTFQRVPGIAELTTAIGLRVQDVATNQATRFTVDPGAVGNLGIGHGSGTVKSDFLLQIGTGWQVSPSV